MSRAMTGQTELRDATRNQQARVGRTVRRVTRDAAVGLHRRMLVNKRSLLVCVTLDASGVGAGRKPRLFELETAVRVMAITALHRAFEHFMMERQIELVLCLAVTTETKLRLAVLEHLQIGDAGLLRVCSGDKHIRGRELTSARLRVS